ncbi:MAG: hypothetical protein ACREOG_15760, partial [Gemmatimonadaceae bacterium]
MGSTSRSPSFTDRGLASARRRKNRQSVIFTSSVSDYFFNHFNLAEASKFPMLPGADSMPVWVDLVLRLSKAPFISIASIRGRTRGGGNE